MEHAALRTVQIDHFTIRSDLPMPHAPLKSHIAVGLPTVRVTRRQTLRTTSSNVTSSFVLNIAPPASRGQVVEDHFQL
jgi:hypothetical protein